MAMQRLKEAAEKAKIELSGMTQANVNLPFITADATGPKHFDMTITRAKFNELTADLVEKTMGPVNQALSDAGLTASDLNKVLLVGGSTVSQQYRMQLRELPARTIQGHQQMSALLLVQLSRAAFWLAR